MVRPNDVGAGDHETTPHPVFLRLAGPNVPGGDAQDKALLLLSDPATGQAAGEATASTGGALNGVWALVALVGFMLVLAGPTLVWVNRGN